MLVAICVVSMGYDVYESLNFENPVLPVTSGFWRGHGLGPLKAPSEALLLRACSDAVDAGCLVISKKQPLNRAGTRGWQMPVLTKWSRDKDGASKRPRTGSLILQIGL